MNTIQYFSSTCASTLLNDPSYHIAVDANVDLMGIRLQVDAEIQYISEKEFVRRRTYAFEDCCLSAGNSSECTTPDEKSPITKWIDDTSINAQPTVAFYLDVKQGSSTLSFFSVLTFKEIQVRFLAQFESDAAFELYIRTKITVFYIADIDAFVSFTARDGFSSWKAEFGVTAEIELGLGKATFGLEGFVEVGEYLYDTSSTAVAPLVEDGGAVVQAATFRDADWDITFTADWETAQWLKDVGEFILEGLKVLYGLLEDAWNAIVGFVEDVWEGIKELVGIIGGAINDLLDGGKYHGTGFL